jgi:hypothetical protein
MSWLDEELPPFTALLRGLADIGDAFAADPSGLRLDRARVRLPIELHVEVGGDGAVRLIGAPPTQHVGTTWMPVWHTMTLEVGPDGGR